MGLLSPTVGAGGYTTGEPSQRRVCVLWPDAGTVDSPPTSHAGPTGMAVAAAEWLRALARHGRAGALDVIVPAVSAGPDALRLGRHLGIDGDRRAAVVGVAPHADAAEAAAMCNCDVLHNPTGLDLSWPTYARSRFGRRVFPITCSQHTISMQSYLHAFFVPLLMADVRQCDAIVCLTQSSREALVRRLGDIGQRYSHAWAQPAPPLPRLELIPWGIDAERFTPRDPGPARRDLGLPTDRPILLCIGRFAPDEKMDWVPLLLAFQHVWGRTNSRPILLIAGADPFGYGAQVIARAGELGVSAHLRTFFNFPPACLSALYAACDVFVSPTDSPTESFGLTILEAMACGRPVVASDWDGYKELIVDGETGFKIRTDWADCLGELNMLAPVMHFDQDHLYAGQSVSVDVGQMAQAILGLLENSDLRVRMGARGRARAEALYLWPTIIAQWESLWDELGGVARSLANDGGDRLSYLQPNYFQHFAHYASRIVDQDTPVVLTPRGWDLLAGRASYLLHPAVRGLIDEETLGAGLQSMAETRSPDQRLRVADLVLAMAKEQGVSRDRALIHVMWLSKYDLIALGRGAERWSSVEAG